MDEESTRPFSTWLFEQRRGALDAELSQELRELVNAVATHQKGGTLTLTVKVAPASGDRDAFVVLDDVKVTLPKGERSPAIWFADENGDLRRYDPRQLRIEVREHTPDPKPIREVHDGE